MTNTQTTLTRKIGDILVDSGLITKEQLKAVLELQGKSSKKVGEMLIAQGFVSERDILEVLEFQLGIPHINPDRMYISPEIPRLISENLARRHVLIPIKKNGNVLTVVMADPLNIYACEDVQIATGCKVEVAIALSRDINSAIEQHYGHQRAEKAVAELKSETETELVDDEGLDGVNSAPVVRFINSIMSQAIKRRASDIHIEPFEDILRVRFRIDGELQEVMSSPKSAHSAIVTRLKIMAEMDIAEKRIPQDGRVETVFLGREVDLRVSTLPTVFGEKVVIRILDRSHSVAQKEDLGLSEENLQLYDKLIKNPHGIIVITGPTGSGKSTTLYTMLSELNVPERNIITVEDPVEYRLEGVNQVQVNNKAGLTFASGLRSILRQDPDVIMIGEIRDSETAQIAVRAAITGHLVLSSMHTNDAASAISRLSDLGVEPYLISTALVGVISQRLVRRICPKCKINYSTTVEDQEVLGISNPIEIYKGTGCVHCHQSGYSGRIATHEILTVGKDVRQLIHQTVDMDSIRTVAGSTGMKFLMDNCKTLVLSGVTTIEEYMRIAYIQD